MGARVEGLRIRVRGQVQGVGFRPYLFALAREFGLSGQVCNDPEGVLAEVFGAGAEAFVAAIARRAPPLARVEAVEVARFDGEAPAGFVILASRGVGAETRVTPDAATCPDCAAEIRAVGRRQGYGFANCTHCGPRFSILRGLPYDRAQTSMAAFALCPDCQAEYDDPGDRRFHAQPVACPACGPRLWFEGAGGEGTGGEGGEDPLARAVDLLQRGGILAIKGLGGFHLACDARDPEALALLRARKARPAKPFALMGPLAALEDLAELTEADRVALQDPSAPILLVPSRRTLPEAVAPGMAQLGVMLPYTPLHHLLLDRFGGVLVMTSANPSGAPQVVALEEARRELAGIADGFLMHDRAIARRLDDSVLRSDPPQVLRRARGLVPGTLPLPEGFGGAPQILALGGQMKAAICLIKSGQAMLGHHLGDLDDARTAEDFARAVRDYRQLFDHHPALVAVDAHPGYRASREGQAMGLPLVEVWHHHAHLASCLAEALWPRDGAKVAGIVLDGLGLGPDGTLWGGEVLLGDYRAAERRFWLRPAPLPGGDGAAREPWRNALARLDQAGLQAWADGLFPGAPRAVLRQAMARGINAPLSSSAGRLFDAVAAVLGLCPERQSYEGEAAMRLEAMAAGEAEAGHPGYALARSEGGAIDPAPLWHEMAADLRAGLAPGRIARRFHRGLARAFAEAARALVESGAAKAVALSGGCFQNGLLTREVLAALEGLSVLQHHQIPANDGGLALGQALVAAARAVETG